jgi:hypothetical protein
MLCTAGPNAFGSLTFFSLNPFSSISLSQKSPYRDRRHAVARASGCEGGCATRHPVVGRAGQPCCRRAGATGQPAPGERECGQVVAPGSHAVTRTSGRAAAGDQPCPPLRKRAGGHAGPAKLLLLNSYTLPLTLSPHVPCASPPLYTPTRIAGRRQTLARSLLYTRARWRRQGSPRVRCSASEEGVSVSH